MMGFHSKGHLQAINILRILLFGSVIALITQIMCVIFTDLNFLVALNALENSYSLFCLWIFIANSNYGSQVRLTEEFNHRKPSWKFSCF